MRSLLITFVLALAVGAPAAAQSGATAMMLAQDPDPYAGNAQCLRCHGEYERTFVGTPHEEFEHPEGLAPTREYGCQTCHGPGRAHVEEPRDPVHFPRIDRLSLDFQRDSCLGCHEDDRHDIEHFEGGEACVSCHPMHEYELGATGAAGDNNCVSCHESPARTEASSFDFRSHGMPHSAEACASCHTLGTLAAEVWEGRAGTEACQECHGQSHPRFFASSHARAGLSCKSCHVVHAGNVVDASAPDGYIGRSSQMCTECHPTAVTEFTFNERHRLEEGAMECSSCHEPHEPTQRVRLGGFKNQQCTGCHIDKMGPFVFEHNPSPVEGCTSCHVPHGSPNRHMLTFQSVADQCYSCHVIAPGFHAPFNSLTLCTNCHSKIHGSNLHPAFLK